MKTNGCKKIGDQIRIRWKGKRILVTILVTIQGGDLVVVDREGQLYTTWWEEHAESSGGHKLQHRHWRRYTKGIYHLSRALRYAMIETEGVKIPTMEELQEFCQKRRAEISLIEVGDSIKHYLETMSGKFDELTSFLAGRRRQGLTEGRTHLSFFLLLRDSKGRVNIGVLQARLTAIDFRFMRELEHLAGWMPHYAARLNAVRRLQQQFQRSIRQVRQSLKAMTTHQAFQVGETSEKQVRGLIAALSRQITVLGQLEAIMPFRRWAKHCLADLAQARERFSRLFQAYEYHGKGCRVEQLQANNLAKVSQILDRLLESMKLRLIGFELEELIEQISVDLLLKQVDRLACWQTLLELIHQVERVDESDLADPVCDGVMSHLYVAKNMLEEYKYPQTKTALKEATALI